MVFIINLTVDIFFYFSPIKRYGKYYIILYLVETFPSLYLLVIIIHRHSVWKNKKFLLVETFVNEIGRHFNNQCHCLLRLALKIFATINFLQSLQLYQQCILRISQIIDGRQSGLDWVETLYIFCSFKATYSVELNSFIVTDCLILILSI